MKGLAVLIGGVNASCLRGEGDSRNAASFTLFNARNGGADGGNRGSVPINGVLLYTVFYGVVGGVIGTSATNNAVGLAVHANAQDGSLDCGRTDVNT